MLSFWRRCPAFFSCTFLCIAVGFYIMCAYITKKKEGDTMMYQKIIVPIDHGNRNLKTEQHVFTSGILESDCKPVLGEFLQYNGRYYTLSEQRIPYMRDKSSDERFFILTLFGIVMEAERQRISSENTILQVELPVGLPPKHYGALHRKFQGLFYEPGKAVSDL